MINRRRRFSVRATAPTDIEWITGVDDDQVIKNLDAGQYKFYGTAIATGEDDQEKTVDINNLGIIVSGDPTEAVYDAILGHVQSYVADPKKIKLTVENITPDSEDANKGAEWTNGLHDFFQEGKKPMNKHRIIRRINDPRRAARKDAFSKAQVLKSRDDIETALDDAMQGVRTIQNHINTASADGTTKNHLMQLDEKFRAVRELEDDLAVLINSIVKYQEKLIAGE